jgi:hypothetical protein
LVDNALLVDGVQVVFRRNQRACRGAVGKAPTRGALCARGIARVDC